MCGINGGLKLNQPTLTRMNRALAHRGPDGSGAFVDEAVSLGHTRLAIIDTTDAGSQPMSYTREQGAFRESAQPSNNATTQYVITFNGEIYNYQELRQELTALGCTFTTESDTEVVLAAYATWGQECVHKFNGMWAFCIYDTAAGQLFLSRDRLGVKPLYYYQKDDSFLFSSELKGFIANDELAINRPENIHSEAVELYFSLGYIPAPYTIYKYVQQLPPAHSMVINIATGTSNTQRYWELPDFNPVYDKQLLCTQGKTLLDDATRIRMRADVSVGAFLSGGLDSSSVVATMRHHTSAEKLHTFSIGFAGVYDETTYVDMAKDAFGTVHHHRYFNQVDFTNELESFATMFDEPMSDHSGFPTQMVSALAREHVTVALSGDGGDEVFGGYASHVLGARLDMIRRIPRFVRSIIAALPVGSTGGKLSPRSFILACRLTLGAPEDFVAEASFGDTLRTDTAKAWLRQAFAAAYQKSGNSFAEAMRIFDAHHNTLPHKYLTKVDRASMHHSLEVRSPYLDYRFYEYAQTIPTKWKVNLRRAKLLLGQIVANDVPAAIIKRKKQGFEPPVYEWLRDPAYEPQLQQALTNLATVAPAVSSWYQQCEQLHTVDPKHIFRLYAFQLWWERWVK